MSATPTSLTDAPAAAPATAAGTTPTDDPIDVPAVRRDFPLLSRKVHDRPIVYLDSAATALTPRPVLAAMERYYETTHANVHRGVYATAEEATNLYEAARIAAGRFIGAPDPAREVVFTKNTTESLNLVAHSWGRANLGAGDTVLLTEMEHHANMVPWLQLAEERGVQLRYVPVDDDGRLDLSELDRLLDGVKLVGVSAMSNVLGTINPLARIAEAAHAAGAVVVADGAQSVPHLPVDVAELGVDFLAFSAHKMMGPTGIGVLWARADLLEAMPPFLGGGGMILDVRLDRFLPAEPPQRFEAGTPPIAEAVGLAAAVEYLQGVGMDRVRAHERALTRYALDALADRLGPDCRVYGPPAGDDRGGVLSLAFKDVHAHDLAQVLDQYSVCVRPGHHCAKPLMRKLGVPATARASFGVYNDEHDVDVLIEGLVEAGRLFG
ncbi:MAG TPA: SufS family cysteine desulfurase [Acidimicrobiales bacterium]|nr:SufS family cysteine desulfurase [Acidimicrobiales bacterium]